MEKNHGDIIQYWTKEVQCTSRGWDSDKNKTSPPCGQFFTIKSSDVVKRLSHGYDKENFCHTIYGFICPNCHRFTPVYGIPDEIKKNCIEVAKKGSPRYTSLTKEGKLLSKGL